jgi:hypothetical protein
MYYRFLGTSFANKFVGYRRRMTSILAHVWHALVKTLLLCALRFRRHRYARRTFGVATIGVRKLSLKVTSSATRKKFPTCNCLRLKGSEPETRSHSFWSLTVAWRVGFLRDSAFVLRARGHLKGILQSLEHSMAGPITKLTNVQGVFHGTKTSPFLLNNMPDAPLPVHLGDVVKAHADSSEKALQLPLLSLLMARINQSIVLQQP